MFKNIAKVLGGDSQKRELERLSAIVDDINLLEEEYESLGPQRNYAQKPVNSVNGWRMVKHWTIFWWKHSHLSGKPANAQRDYAITTSK